MRYEIYWTEYTSTHFFVRGSILTGYWYFTRRKPFTAYTWATKHKERGTIFYDLYTGKQMQGLEYYLYKHQQDQNLIRKCKRAIEDYNTNVLKNNV